MIHKFLLPALAALPLASAAPAEVAVDPAADRVRGHVEFLADDLLEGRATGERGHAIAASYVASQFRALGLQPGGENGGWYQQVPFRRAAHDGAPSVKLTLRGKRAPLTIGKDIALSPSLTERERKLEAPLVFVGYGISEPKLGIDDYRGLDVRGKIVLALNGAPEGIPTEIAAHIGAIKADTAAAHGAVGYVNLSTKPGEGSRPDILSRFATRPLTDWVDAQGRAGTQPAGLRVEAGISPELATRLFEGSARSLAAVRAEAARKAARPRGFPLKASLAVDSKSTWTDFKSPEVIGLLPGADPKLRNEYVVLMGHLDHLGIKGDAAPGTDAVYNGAIDNAAGIATLLEAAQEFRRSGKAPRRSVMFIANTGEELGLLGADYFAGHPTVPIGQIVAGVDLDMPLPLYDFTDIVAFGADHSTVAQDVARAAKSMNVTVSPDPMPQESIFVRSDHYQFVKRGVPAILLFTGYANGGKAHWDKFLPTVYHSVKDDLGQAIHWGALARYGQVNYRIARALADADGRPRWYEGDYFGDAFAPGQPRAKRRP